LLTCPSESQVMSTSVPSRVGASFSRLTGMMGNSWPKRPVVQQRLEHGEIAEELVAQTFLQLADFLRHVRPALKLCTTSRPISQ
jgi:hypothetical protein